MSEVGRAATAILVRRGEVPRSRTLLVGVSGIDGAGKGYLTARITARLLAENVRAAAINVDGWLNLPQVRFDPKRPAEAFYERAVRFDELFEKLVLPIRRRRSVRVEADFAEETATAFRRHVWEFEDLDVLIVEGIYLFRRDLRPHFDMAIWVDCSFETALERAIARGQEGLPHEETVRSYETIYFPAQRIHFERDDPRSGADLILVNDRRPKRPLSPGEGA